MSRTALFSRKQPGGVFVIDDIEQHPGAVFFVHSGTGTDGTGYGKNPDAPCATWDYAVGLCTASKGDVIYLMPGHAEDVEDADGVDLDVIGVKTVGLGHGALKPTISFTAAAGSITIAVASIWIENVKLVANFATGTVTGLTIDAAGDNCTLKDIDFRDTSAANEFLIHASVATTVADLHIQGCTFVTAAGSMTGSVVFAGSSTNALVEDSKWYVDSSDSVVDHQTTAAVNFQMYGCKIVNIDGGAAGYCVELKTASTGILGKNYMAYGKTDAEVFLGDACWWYENYMCNTIAESGVLYPVVASAIP